MLFDLQYNLCVIQHNLQTLESVDEDKGEENVFYEMLEDSWEEKREREGKSDDMTCHQMEKHEKEERKILQETHDEEEVQRNPCAREQNLNPKGKAYSAMME